MKQKATNIPGAGFLYLIGAALIGISLTIRSKFGVLWFIAGLAIVLSTAVIQFLRSRSART